MVSTALQPIRSSSTLRTALGLAVSAAFMAIALSRTDLGSLARLSGDLSIAFVGVAAIVSLVEVSSRAVRWRVLLSPIAPISYSISLAYLGIGHLANAVLPARLGDVARAYLAGGRLEVSRLSVLGTIATERVADASLLALVGTGAVVVGRTELMPAVAAIGGVAVIGVAVAALAYASLGQRAVFATRIGRLLASLTVRFVHGASALRSWRTLGMVLALTGASFLLATLIMQASAAAVGLSVPPLQAALIIAAVTLSTAIPAGPASIGTYEFVGVTVMSAMGFDAEPAFASILLVHVIATLVPAAIGLVGMWSLGIRHLTPPARRADA